MIAARIISICSANAWSRTCYVTDQRDHDTVWSFAWRPHVSEIENATRGAQPVAGVPMHSSHAGRHDVDSTDGVTT